MNKREKILLGLLSTLLMIYLGQKATSLVKNDNKALLKQYSTSDLQKVYYTTQAVNQSKNRCSCKYQKLFLQIQ